MTPKLPTYQSAAAVLEGTTGSGIKLLGWTIARTILIGPPMMAVGVPAKQAFFGAALASALISSLALLRIAKAGPMTPLGVKRGLGERFRVHAKHPRLRGSQSICIDAPSKKIARERVEATARGVRVTRIGRGC